jgi:PPM family protein phosphatase
LIGALSDVGNFRKVNEDYIGHYIDENKSFYILADGVGGHNGGEIASSTAVNEAINYIKTAADLSNPSEVLREAVLCANSKVYNLSVNNPSLAGMGTTITACLIVSQTCYVANVGDSSCYVIRGDDITKVTKDHSLVQELIDKGNITEDEARTYPIRNVITRAIGTSAYVNVDIFMRPLKSIEKIMLCSDGLTDEVSRKEIKDCIKQSRDNMDTCRLLVELAKKKGGKDNISVMIFEGVNENDWHNTGE